MNVFGSRRLGPNYFTKVNWKFSLQVKHAVTPLLKNNVTKALTSLNTSHFNRFDLFREFHTNSTSQKNKDFVRNLSSSTSIDSKNKMLVGATEVNKLTPLQISANFNDELHSCVSYTNTKFVNRLHETVSLAMENAKLILLFKKSVVNGEIKPISDYRAAMLPKLLVQGRVF
jgi:hypothetical protein